MVGYAEVDAPMQSDSPSIQRNGMETVTGEQETVVPSEPVNGYEVSVSKESTSGLGCSTVDDDPGSTDDPIRSGIDTRTFPTKPVNGHVGLDEQQQMPPPTSNGVSLSDLSSTAAAVHGYAGFDTSNMQPSTWPKQSSSKDLSAPLSINVPTSSQQPPRRLSPVSTSHRRQAIHLREEKTRAKRRRIDGVSMIVDFVKTGRLVVVPEDTSGPSGQAAVVPNPAETARKRQKLVGTPLPNEMPVVTLPTVIDRQPAGQERNTSYDGGDGEMQSDKPIVLPTVRVQDLITSAAVSSSNSRNGQQLFGPDDIPPQPVHPTDPDEIRKLMRSKMLRCKRCRNRFVERCLYERHLKEKHHDDYIVYMAQQEEEMEQQRREELEQMKHEEIQCGGYIPPASEVDSSNFINIDANSIPLPGEGFGGQTPRFDRWGAIKFPRKPYKKKVSPQCPFCDKRFRNENSLKKHLAKKHPDAVNFVQCNNCYKAVKNDTLIDNHDCELTYICFECVPIRNLCTENRLNNHRAKFHRGANSGFRCNECNRKFLTPRKLRKHKKMAHVVTKPFKCHFCDEFFPTETQVSLHERIHTGKVKYECNICDFRANRYPKLDKHKRDEHGYMCCICQEKMSEWAELKHHTLDKHGGYMTSERGARYVESPRVWILYVGE